MRLPLPLTLMLALLAAPQVAQASLLDLTLTPPALDGPVKTVRLIDDGSPMRHVDDGGGGELEGWDAFWAITLGVTGLTVSVASVGAFAFGALLAAGGAAGGVVIAAIAAATLLVGMNLMALTTLWFLEPPLEKSARTPSDAPVGLVVWRFDAGAAPVMR